MHHIIHQLDAKRAAARLGGGQKRIKLLPDTNDAVNMYYGRTGMSVALSPILLVSLGILFTDGVELPDQEPKRSARLLNGLLEHEDEKHRVCETWES